MAGQRGSLLDDEAFQNIGVKKSDQPKSKASKSQTDMIKIAVAAALLVVAIVVLAWHFGAFDSGKAKLPPGVQPREISAEEEAEKKQHEERMLRLKERGIVSEGGA